MKRIYGYSLTLILMSGSLTGISERTATIIATGAGATGALAGYVGANTYNASPAATILTTLLSALGTAFGAHFIASKFTPYGKYKRAYAALQSANDELLTLNIGTYAELKSYLKRRYANDWYLVSGKNRLQELHSTLIYAQNLLEDACNEKSADRSLISLSVDCKRSIDQLLSHYRILIDLIDADSEEYYRQRHAFDEYLARQQRDQERSDKKWDNLEKYLQKERLHREKMELKRRAR